MQRISEAVEHIAERVFGVKVTADLTRPEPEFGDYTTNIALRIAKQVGKTPRDVASSIATELAQILGNDIAAAHVAGPGFINITLADAALFAQAVRAAKNRPMPYKNKVIIAEYSDPNPFKVLHAGHLYTTLVGDAIAHLLQVGGATVHRVNYGGDVGLHVAKAMWAIIRDLGGEHPNKLEAIPLAQRPDWVTARYVEGSAAYEDDATAKQEIIAINKKVYALHAKNDHDLPFAQIYWTCRQWSYDGFNELYKKLQIHPFDRFIPESEVTPTGIEIVQKGVASGVFEQSDGATVFRGEPYGLHTRVFVNSAGLPTYEAKDLGLAATKWRDYRFDVSFMITGNDIVDYMKVVLAALSHFYPDVAERTRHITHGMIRLPGGKKMSSRKGNNPKAHDILKAAYAAAHNAADDRVVIGAVKYAFLKQRTGGDMVYNPEESVSMDGNSGPYIQYAHARARSILAKGAANEHAAQAENLDTYERSVAQKLCEYPDVVQKATIELMPHYICTYLYELAQVFNRFYEHSRVIGDERQALRLALVGAYADTLKDGLSILNIEAPDSL